MASDGVFDKMSNDDIARCVWDSCDKNKWQQAVQPGGRPAQSIHQQCGLGVESVLKNSLYRQSLDNVTVVIIAFQNFKRFVFGQGKNSDREEQESRAERKSQAKEVPYEANVPEESKEERKQQTYPIFQATAAIRGTALN
jgi:serine/threonine protein phosphatase PrpC